MKKTLFPVFLMVILVSSVFFPFVNLPFVKANPTITYTEVWDYFFAMLGDPVAWVTYDIHTNHNIPKDAVVELIVYNVNTLLESETGIREVGSSLTRILELPRAEDGGRTTTRFLVQVDANGNIEYYRNNVCSFGVRIVSYWTGVDFTETWVDLHIVKADESIWVDRNLYAEGIPKGSGCLASLVNRAPGNEYEIGVRTDGSSLSRIADIHEAEGGGEDVASMFVKTSEADGIIEIWCEDEYDDCSVIIQGYFGADMDFTELMTVKDVTASGIWEEVDLTGDLDEDGRVTDFLLTNNDPDSEWHLGARVEGSFFNRWFLEYEAEAGGVTGFGMSVKSDANGVVELYCGNAYFDTFYLTGYFKFVEPVNTAPVNDSCTIIDMDDSNNLYAQISGGYSIDYDGHDDDGYVDIDYVLVNITQAATVRVSFKYDNSLDEFSIVDGSSEFTLDGSSSASRAGININLTIVFHVQFDATEEAATELKCVIADDEPETDIDTMQTDYADVVTNLVVSGFSYDDDRGDVSQTITFTGTVYYANNPASSTATTFYPPDAEFTAVHVYDSGDNDKGNDNTVVNGAFSVSFAASASVGIETYNPYIDMDDADYSDAEESPTDTFISDQIQLLTLSSNDTALYTGEYTEIRATAELEYDHHALGSGDSLTIEGLALSWDAGDSRFEGSETSEVELSKTYNEGVGTEATFGITVVNMDGNSVTVTWEKVEELAKIEFLWLGILVNLILVPLLIIFLYAIRRRR